MDTRTAELTALDAALGEAHRRGREAFPELVLDEATFARHLATLCKEGTPAEVQALVAEDLFLARACVARAADAANIFAARYGATIRSAIARIAGRSDVEEMEQQLLHELLLESVDAPPKIASYAGRAPLERWIAVAAQRTALMSVRQNRAETRALTAAAAEPLLAGRTHPEMTFLKERYRGEFERALAEALGRLSDREQLLLRLHLVSNVSLEKIGKMFAVSQPTASRWLAAARQSLRNDIEKTLAERLGATSSELTALAAMVASRLDLSISALLKRE